MTPTLPPISRLGAIGDVHAEDEALAAAYALLRRRGVDAVVCLGDLVDGEGDINAALALLMGEEIATVRGNHDRWFIARDMLGLPNATAWEDVSPQGRAFLASLPPTRSLTTCRGELLVCHGLGADDMTRLKPDHFGYELEVNAPLQQLLREQRYRFVLSGHTHVRMVRTLGDITFLNAGTLKRDDDPCVALIDFAGGVVEFHDLVGGPVQTMALTTD